MKQLLVICALLGSASASVIFTLGNHPQPNEQNISSNFYVDTNEIIDHDASGNLVAIATNGLINATPAGFNWLRSRSPDWVGIWVTNPRTPNGMNPFLVFGDIILDPVDAIGPLTVRVGSYTSGVCGICSDSFTWNGGAGDNYLTITTNDHTRMTAISLYGDFNGFDNLQMSDITAPTPEPGTLALLGTGLLGIGGLLRKR